MENRYFKRDISWLSFNYRVLLEAEDDTLPLYERINFISIYSSNLEEFYKIRVADHKAIATGASQSDEETVQSAAELVTGKSTANWKTVSASTNRRYCPPYGNTTSYSIRAATWNRFITTSCATSSAKRYSPIWPRCP